MYFKRFNIELKWNKVKKKISGIGINDFLLSRFQSGFLAKGESQWLYVYTEMMSEGFSQPAVDCRHRDSVNMLQ